MGPADPSFCVCVSRTCFKRQHVLLQVFQPLRILIIIRTVCVLSYTVRTAAAAIIDTCTRARDKTAARAANPDRELFLK